MNCPKCQKQIPDTAKFCNHCGCNVKEALAEAQSSFCNNCGAKLNKGDTFCCECGAKVAGAASASTVSDDPWAEVDGKKTDSANPWAGFQDSFEAETKIEEKIVEVVKYVEVPSQSDEVETKNGNGFDKAAFQARADELLSTKRMKGKSALLKKLIDELEVFANDGELDAMLMLPALCDADIDYDKGYFWREQAIEAGADDPKLIIKVASHYYIKNQFAKAKELFDELYEKGNGEAAYWLYELYNNSDYSSANLNTSLKYFKEAVRLGYDLNIYRWIGDRYFYGKGLTGKDYTEAVKYYRIGTELGMVAAEYMLGEAYLCGCGVTQDMPKAVEIFKKIASKNSDAEKRLSECYMFGWGVKENYDEALRIARKYEKDFLNSQACYLLGYAYRYGLGVTKDLEAAKKYLKKSYDDRAKKLLAEM